MVGVAVNVTLFPEQIEVDDALIETAGVTEFVVMVITLLPAVDEIAQFAFDVMITLTWSPLVSVVGANIGAFMPALEPFICHW